jgi:hypothetical protein
MFFLAHLAKGNVSFCHHLASVVRRLLTFQWQKKIIINTGTTYKGLYKVNNSNA